MNNDEIYEKIVALLHDTSMPPMVLLDGKWGSGKSYYVNRHFISKLEVDTREPVVCFSLYGISNIDDFRDKLISAYYLKDKDSAGFLNKCFCTVVDATKFEDYKTSGAISSVFGGLKGIAKHSILSKIDNFSLILDDMERVSNKDSIEKILGECLQLVDGKNIKIIVVGNSSAIDDISSILDKSFIDKVKFVITPSEMVDIAFENFSLSAVNKSKVLETIQTLDLNNLRILKRSANRLKPLLEKVKVMDGVDWETLFNTLIPKVISICYVHYEKGISCDDIKKKCDGSSMFSMLDDDSESKSETEEEKEKEISKILSLATSASDSIVEYACGERLSVSDVNDFGYLPMKSQPIDKILNGGIKYISESGFDDVYSELTSYINEDTEPDCYKWFLCCDALKILVDNGYVIEPSFLNGDLISYVKSSIINKKFKGGEYNSRFRSNLADNQLTEILNSVLTEIDKDNYDETLADYKVKMLSSWSNVDSESYDKYRHTPFLNKVGDDFIKSCILNWTHADILLFEDFMRSRYSFSNIKDLFLPELECLSSLNVSIANELNRFEPSLKRGAMNELFDTLSRIETRLK